MRQALYRLYRPRTFEEVVGQEPIITVLKSEMRQGQPSHAYLFIGSRGTGKTTCAKLVAKAVNCLSLHDGSPCGECTICRGVDDGSLLDVVEIDAASNNGVDSIRDLRSEAVFTPAIARYRVYIIDEVHMLSTSAFNALLKILEEPPEHVIFILATTEIQKVLPTIISRCQRFDFQRIESSIIADRLLAVAQKETLSLSPDAAGLIARLSDGGMRDALSLLDVCAANTDSVDVETVASAAGLAGSAHLMQLTDHIILGDTPKMLSLLSSLVQKGMDPQRLSEQLAGHYRNLMLAKTLEHPERLLDCLPTEIQALQAQAQQLALPDLLQSITALQDAIARMSKSTIKRAELELALVTLCEPSIRTGYQALLTRIERLEAALRRGAAAAPPAAAVVQPTTNNSTNPPAAMPLEAVGAPPAATAPSPTAAAPLAPFLLPSALEEALPVAASPPVSAKVEKRPASKATRVISDPLPSSDLAPDPSTGGAEPEPSVPLPFRPWAQVIDQLSGFNSSIAGMLRGTKSYFDGKRVLIDVSNPAVLEMLKSNDYTRQQIKQAIFEVTGQSLSIGPYRSPVEEAEQADPLEQLIASLPSAENITIER